ncbi:MAG: hypothetical protein ACRC1I_11155 [Pseudomonas proteolytica]
MSNVAKVLHEIVLPIMKPTGSIKTFLRLGKLQPHCVVPMAGIKDLQHQGVNGFRWQFNAPSANEAGLITQYSAYAITELALFTQ